MFDLKKIQENLDSLQELANVAKSVNCLLDAEKMSADNSCEKYIKDNHLEYIADEIRAAFHIGFITYGRQREWFDSLREQDRRDAMELEAKNDFSGNTKAALDKRKGRKAYVRGKDCRKLV